MSNTVVRVAFAAAALCVLAGCASAPSGATGADAAAPATNPVDPWEPFNRKVYTFNDALDRHVLKPVAETYRDVVPKLVRTGVNNFFGNIRDVWSAANNLLQGKVQRGLDMGMRVLSNTLFGLGGLLDPATEFGLARQPEDFGLTLGHWGFGNGPFVMLPLFGPSTVRDTVGLVADRQTAPSTLPETSAGRDAVAVLEVVSGRTNLLDAGDLLDKVALDRYSFLRDAYLARRRDAFYDGAPPLETFDDDAADAKSAAPAAAASAASAPAR